MTDVKRAGDVTGIPEWQQETDAPLNLADLEMNETVDLRDEDGRFRIKDDQTADWAIRQIRRCEAKKAEWKAFYDERYKAMCYDLDLTIANMESLLQSFFATVPHKVTPTQENYALPSGKLVIKQQEPDYERDDEKVIEWLRSHKGERFIRIKEALDWNKFKHTLTVAGETVADSNGEIIPGIKAIERGDAFKVEFKKEA